MRNGKRTPGTDSRQIELRGDSLSLLLVLEDPRGFVSSSLVQVTSSTAPWILHLTRLLYTPSKPSKVPNAPYSLNPWKEKGRKIKRS